MLARLKLQNAKLALARRLDVQLCADVQFSGNHLELS